MTPTHHGAIWLCGPGQGRARALPLRAALESLGAACVMLGRPGDPPPDLDLGPEPDMSLALESAPRHMRPLAAIALNRTAPAGMDGLPCPLLALDDLPGDPALAARQVLEAAARGPVLSWLPRVQVNMPLRDLLGRYSGLLDALRLNLEVGIDAPALDTLGPADLESALRITGRGRVTAHLPFFDLCPGSADPLIAEASARRLLDAARWAIRLGAVQAVAHLGYWTMLHRQLDEFAQRYARAVAPVARELARAGCAIVLENTMEPGPEPLLACRRALAAESGCPVGLCLDVGHARCFSEQSLETWWEAVSPHLGEMHLHDNDSSDDQHLPVGAGGTDWAWLRARLDELPRQPILTLEPHSESHLWASLRGLQRVWGAGGH